MHECEREDQKEGGGRKRIPTAPDYAQAGSRRSGGIKMK